MDEYNKLDRQEAMVNRGFAIVMIILALIFLYLIDRAMKMDMENLCKSGTVYSEECA